MISGELRDIERARLNRTIRECIIVRGRDCVRNVRASIKRRQVKGRRNVPLRWKILKREENLFVATVRNVHENHGWIDKGVLFVELRSIWSGAVPVDRITDGY